MKDKEFTTEANEHDDLPVDQVFYHLQYSLPFVTPYAPIQGVLNGDKQMTAVLDDLQKVAEASPLCAPVLPVRENDAGQQLLEGQNEVLKEFTSQADAVGDEQSYVTTAAEIANGFDLPITLRPEYAQGIHMLLSTFPVDSAAWSDEALRFTEKNVTIRFPQFVRVDEVLMGDLAPDTFALELQNLNAVMIGLYEGQPGASYQEPAIEREPEGEQIPLLPLSGGNVTVRLNQDSTPIAYSYSIPVIGDVVQTPLSTVSAYDAFLQSLRQAYNIDEDGEDVVKAIEDRYGDFDAQPLRLDAWSWGYSRFHNGEYHPEALFLNYYFEFGPNVEAGYSAETHPPRSFSEDGQTNEPCS